MAVREVLPEVYDDLDQKLEKELPLSICGLVHFRLMRRKHLLTEKMVLVDSWPDFSVLVILDRQVCFSINSSIKPHFCDKHYITVPALSLYGQYYFYLIKVGFVNRDFTNF
uniref:Glycine N-acyltransferase-like protein n=1 Tax=Magallana gigas TaxID=29159 RepID=A0A8W8HPZ6_MAGGI